MRRIAVRAIIIKDGKLLLAKLKPYRGGPDKDYYCTIGGGLDDNEDLTAGLKREVYEETGIMPEVGRLLYVQQYTDRNDNIEFFFLVTNADDFMHIDLTKSSHGNDEIEEINFFDPKEVYVLPAFLKEVDITPEGLSSEVKIYNYIKK